MKIDEVLMFAFEKSKEKLFEHAASLPGARVPAASTIENIEQMSMCLKTMIKSEFL